MLMYSSSCCLLSLSTHKSFPCPPLLPPFLAAHILSSALFHSSLFCQNMKGAGKGKRERHAVSMSTCTCLFTVHAHVYTHSLLCGECVWQHVCIQTNFPLILYLYCLLPKTAALFLFCTCAFFLTVCALQNNNQTPTWVLNELKQAPKLCVTQTLVCPFARSGQRSYSHIDKASTSLLQHCQWSLHRLEHAASGS